MSELKNAKDALVASLFELSKAAQDAATATVNFYKASSNENLNGESLNSLASTLNNIATSTSAAVPEVEEASSPVASAGAASGALVATNGGETQPEEKKKRKKVEKDPNAPKKPLTIYFAYSFYTRDQIRQERAKQGLSPLSASELNEIIKERWSSISPEEKSKWQSKYQNELQQYNILRDAYKAGKPDVGQIEPKSIEQITVPTIEPVKKAKSESKKRKSESKKLDDAEKSEKTEKEPKKSKKSKKSEKSEKS